MDDIHSRKPVDRLAAQVVQPGVHFTPEKKVLSNDSDTPIAVRPIPKAARSAKNFDDLTGRKFGRFTVIGLARDFKKQWVVRCDCGRYSTRHSKAVKNPANEQDRCEHCRHLAYLKREEHWRRTGRDRDIREF